MKIFATRLPDELYEKSRKIAKRRGCSMVAVCRKALEVYIILDDLIQDNPKEKRKVILITKADGSQADLFLI